MDVKDLKALIFTILVAVATPAWIINAVGDGSVLTWFTAALWLVLATLLIRDPMGRRARQKRNQSLR